MCGGRCHGGPSTGRPHHRRVTDDRLRRADGRGHLFGDSVEHAADRSVHSQACARSLYAISEATSTTEVVSAAEVTSTTEFTSLAADNEIQRSVDGSTLLTTGVETTRVDDRISRVDMLGSLNKHIFAHRFSFFPRTSAVHTSCSSSAGLRVIFGGTGHRVAAAREDEVFAVGLSGATDLPWPRIPLGAVKAVS